MSFKLHAVVSSGVKSHAAPLRPARDVISSVQHVHVVGAPLPGGHFVASPGSDRLSRYHSARVQGTLILMVASQRKSRDAGDSDVPKRGRTVLPMSEKVCTYRKKTKVYMAFDNIQLFRHLLGVLGCTLPR